MLPVRGYDETLDKLALAVESAKLAKSIIVKTEGIGEDMNFSLMGWRDDELLVVAQLSSEHMEDKEGRYERILQCACILRQGWGVTALTLVAEGYCSTNPEETKGKDMAQLFAVPENDFIRECLSFTHVEDEDVVFVAVPYKCAPPRVVQFSGPLQHQGPGVVRDARYPVGLLRALELEIEDLDSVDSEYFHDLVARGIMGLGFEINYR